MKLQRSTLILILTAIALGGFVYVYEIEGRPLREAAKNQENKIFSFEEKQVQSVNLKTKEQTLLFERNSTKPGDKSIAPKWLLTVLDRNQPAPAKPPEAKTTEKPKETNLTKVPANEAYVSYLLDRMVEAKGDRIVLDPRISYGLDRPQATIKVTLNNGKNHEIILGQPNFNKSSLYAIADPPAEVKQTPQIVLVSTDFENAVNRPLSEWRQPEEKKPPESKPKTDKPAVDSSKKDDKNSARPAAKESKKRQKRSDRN